MSIDPIAFPDRRTFGFLIVIVVDSILLHHNLASLNEPDQSFFQV
jgi:hypothetical protein